MLNKQIKFDSEARASIKNGMDKLADAVKSTLGPQGRCVVIGNWDNGQPHITKDGVTVAKSIQLSDPFENIGCQLIREAALKTLSSSGDATTTSIVFAQAFCNQIENDLADYKVNIPEYKNGICDAKRKIVDELKKMSTKVSESEDILNIAKISANNDFQIGELISNCYKLVGKDGVITVDFSKNTETTTEVVSGMQFDRGFLAPHFVTDEAKNQCILDHPYIFISNQKILRTKDIVPILEPIAKSGESILLIAEEFDDEVLENLKLNKLQNILKCCAIKAPSFGDYRNQLLEDLAILTDGTAITYDSGIEVHDATTLHLGRCQKVIVTKDTCTIIGGEGDKAEINKRVEIIQSKLKELIASPDPNDFTEKFYKTRIARLTGGVSTIHVGATTELAMRELKDRIDDAICATKAAVEEGIVIGGGMSFYNIMKSIKEKSVKTSYDLGYWAVVKNLDCIVKQIITNSEGDYDELSKQFTKTKGYNALNRNIRNLIKDGIINPVKCERLAFENAISVAEMFLMLNCVIADEPINQLVI